MSWAHPHMDNEGLRCFESTLATSKCYLEYGCGGSTLYACQIAKVPCVIAVDSDKSWISRVQENLGNSGSTELYIQYCDIGVVGNWGKAKTRDRIDTFWQYMCMPWDLAQEKRLVPDTVLIDGRFRVASFLYTLIAAEEGVKVLFDDYFDRPHYFVVERFCKPTERRGRMAVFSVCKHFNLTELVSRIAEYSIRLE